MVCPGIHRRLVAELGNKLSFPRTKPTFLGLTTTFSRCPSHWHPRANLHRNYCALEAALYPSASKCKSLINKGRRNVCRNAFAGNFHSLAHIVNTHDSKCWLADGNTHWPDEFMDVWSLVAVHIAFRTTFSSQWAKSWCSLKLLEVLPPTLMSSGFGFVSTQTKITRCCKLESKSWIKWGETKKKREREFDALVRFRMEFCPISVSPCSEGGSPTTTQINIWPRKKCCFISQQWDGTPAPTTGDQKLSLVWHLRDAPVWNQVLFSALLTPWKNS